MATQDSTVFIVCKENDCTGNKQKEWESKEQQKKQKKQKKKEDYCLYKVLCILANFPTLLNQPQWNNIGAIINVVVMGVAAVITEVINQNNHCRLMKKKKYF